MKQTLKKSVSILLSLIMVFSLFTIVPITASAEESDVYLTDFLPVSSSGTATGYSTYDNHFYKIEWSGINTSETSSVQLHIYNYRLRCYRNDNVSSCVSLYENASNSYWESSYITNLTPGQSSDGYTSYPKLGNGASNTSIPHVYKKVCTVTCMAANTPTWNWAADGSSCTATFTCSANSSLTATVNADVTTSGGTATASVTFNGTSYTVTNYNITYVLNGGKNASGNPSTYADNVGVSSFAAPTREHYTFGGWYDNENCTGTPVTSIPAGSSGDRTLYAKWTIDSYTVTWKNSDGSTLKTEQVNYGETPVYSGATPVKPATAQYTYFFFGWSPKISAVTGDQTYTAQFSSTFTKYKVTWKDADGTVLETDNNVSYGTTPVYNGATPAKPSDDKYSYSFKGWNPSVSSVTGDVTYTATYTKTPNPNHFSQDGDTYKIHNETGWDIFCDMLADNDKGVFTGKTVKLADDITVTRMAGSSYHDFTGTFNGQGHTLTFNSTDAVDYCAPFRYTEGTPVFRDLIIDGTINTSGAYAAGLIGHLYGNVSIERCTSRVEITSNGNSGGFVGLCENEVAFTNCVSSAVIHCNEGNNSGFVGWSRSSKYTISFEGCVFNGKLLKNDGTGNNGGFIGWKGDAKTVTVTNCLYAPAALVEGEAFADSNSATFSREHSNYAATITNCYYTAALGTAQGKQAYTISAGENVTLAPSGTAKTYTVSGITAYENNNGLLYGDKFYAGNGDSVSLTLGNTTPTGYAFAGYTVTAGTLEGTENPYTLTMPDSNVAVTAELEEVSYFDASTGTLTLKGTIHNNKGIVLPDGVNKAAVLHINVDSSGATLPRDSSSLFQKFTNVTSIDLTGADTRNVTNMSCMFYYCENLTELDLSSFDTSRVSDMSFMFSGCGHLTELNLSSFDTRNVTEMNSMFFGCFLLETIYVSEQWRTESVIFSTEMFENCGLLTGGNGTAFDLDYTDKTYAVIDKDGQPGYLTGVYTLTLPDHMEIVTDADENMKLGSRYLKGAVVTVRYTGEVKEGYSLIASANGIALPEENGVYTITIPDSNVAVTAVVDVESTFDASTGTLTLKGTVLNGGRDKSIVLPDGVNKGAVLRINVDSSGATLPQDSSRLFYNFTSVTSIDLTGADTRNVTKMNYMFYCCENLTELDLSSFDTGNVTNMSYMFDCCNNLTELDLSSFDTGNVTDMNYMFFSCENLTELDLSSFDTGNVTDMNSMFDCCNNLTELDLSSFDTSFVNYMAGMFSGCEHLTELNLSSFDTSSVTIMSFMFGNCMELKTIYVSDKWNTGSVTNSGNMFSSCTNLTDSPAT